MSRRGKISPEEKAKTVEGVLRGEIGCREAGRRLGVAYESVRAWIKKYEPEGPSAFVPTERNRSDSAELKAAAVQDMSLAEKVCRKFVKDASELHICRAMDIRSTVKCTSHGCTRRAKNPQYLALNRLNRQFMPAGLMESG